MKIVHVITRLDQGGSATDTLALLQGQATTDNEIILVNGTSEESLMTPPEQQQVDKDLQAAVDKGVRLIALSSLVRRISPSHDLKAFGRMCGLFYREKPDIIHTHTSKAGLLGRWAAFFTRTPVIIHTPHGHVFHGYFTRITSKLFILLERITAWITDAIIAVSERERIETLEQGIGSPHKLVTIYSAVDLNRFMNLRIDIEAKKKEFGIPADHGVVGTVGRLVTVKGHTFLLDAARAILAKRPRTVFVLVGEGDLHGELEKQAEQLGIREKIIFAGWHSDVSEIIPLFDVFVLPSINEGMGKVLVEAMAAGKPVVASRVGGIIDLIHDGENGILVPPAQPQPLAEAILALLADENLRKRYGSAGKKKVYPEFDITTMIRKVDELYNDLYRRKTKKA